MSLTDDQIKAQLSERESVRITEQIGNSTPGTAIFSAELAEKMIEKNSTAIPEARRGNLEEAVAAAYEIEMDKVTKPHQGRITASSPLDSSQAKRGR